MSPSRFAPIALLVALAVSSAFADDGNGNGNAIIKHTPVEIGGTLNIQWGSDTAPFGQTLLVISDGIGPTTYPGLGPVCLDLFSPATQIVVDQNLNSMGRASLTVGIPNIAGLTTLPPIYAVALVVDFSQPNPFTISKTVGFYFENPAGFSPTAPLGLPRAFHTATALAEDAFDNEVEVLVTGGSGPGVSTYLTPRGGLTSELFSPATRTFRPGPLMSFPRAMHRAVRLPNGTVLVCGGSNDLGNVYSSCEIYDPVTETFSPTGAMILARAGHQATLLDNGKVLVTGGVPSLVGAATSSIGAVLGAAHDKAELYDPATGTWSLVPGTMSSRRYLHSDCLLADGRVLITCGINGGALTLFQPTPTMTSTCDLYDPVTNTLSPAPTFAGGRAGHATSRLANGEVLLTGGIVTSGLGGTASLATCFRFTGTNWQSAAILPTAVAFHSQVTANSGTKAVIMGGLGGSSIIPVTVAAVSSHNVTASGANPLLGTNLGDGNQMASPRFGHTCTPLYDGTFVVIGGVNDMTTLDSGFVYLEG